jgi:hypothetical protein
MPELGGLSFSRGLGSEASHEWERLVVALSVPISGSHFPFLVPWVANCMAEPWSLTYEPLFRAGSILRAIRDLLLHFRLFTAGAVPLSPNGEATDRPASHRRGGNHPRRSLGILANGQGMLCSARAVRLNHAVRLARPTRVACAA